MISKNLSKDRKCVFCHKTCIKKLFYENNTSYWCDWCPYFHKYGKWIVFAVILKHFYGFFVFRQMFPYYFPSVVFFCTFFEFSKKCPFMTVYGRKKNTFWRLMKNLMVYFTWNSSISVFFTINLLIFDDFFSVPEVLLPNFPW